MMGRFQHHLPFGATTDGPTTHFRFWAPARDAVSLDIEGMPPMPMTAAADGWFEATAPCGAGARYRYGLGSDLTVPDPAARAQAEGVHGPSLVVNPLDYAWRNPDWRGRPWHECLLYELHVGTFGGFAATAASLQRLAELGMTAIELMPIGDFPGARNWGYDGVLPFAPATAYGSPNDLKALIDTAHGMGVMVFLDVIYNHFGPDGNWLARYAPQFFREDLHTPWGPAIDFRRPEVRDFFIQNALYWLIEYRFDGLRFDAADTIPDQDWLDVMAARVRMTVEPGRHVHLVLEHGGNVASHLEKGFDAQWNDDGHHVLHVLLTGESDGYYVDYAMAPARQLARCLAEGFVYQGDPSAFRGGSRRGTPSAHLSPTSFVFFLQNHDQIGNRAFGERLTTLAPAAALRAAIALVLLAPQIPLLFMGEEWGSRSPFLYFTSHNPELAEAVRRGRAEEFAAFGAFGEAHARQSIPDPNDPATFARSIPEPPPTDDAGAWLAFYRTLIATRHREVVPRLPGARALPPHVCGRSAVVAHWRMGDGSELSIAINLGKRPAKAPADAAGAGSSAAAPRTRLLFESVPGAGAALAAGQLPPSCTVALLRSAP